MIAQKIPSGQLLTSSEVGAILQVNPSTIKKWVTDGRISAFRTPGGHYRIRASDLVHFLDHHKMPVPNALKDAARRRVLIVDDDPAQLRLWNRLFVRHAERVQ